MNLVSSFISLIVNMIIKIFTVFGVNGFLVLVLAVEVVACVGYTEATSHYDQKSAEYSFAGLESVTELSADDPFLKQNGIDEVYPGEHFYCLRIKIWNKYNQELRYPSLDAETTEGDMLICTRVPYYGEDVKYYEYGVSEVIPAATEGVLGYMVHIRESKLEKSNQIEIRDLGEDTEDVLKATLPWE